MKLKTFIFILSLGVISFSTQKIFAQEPVKMNQEEHNRMDSLQKVDKKEKAQVQVAQDSKITNLKDESNKANANAAETKRIDNEASDAAKESKKALKTEKKAQKTRMQADKQALKAEKAKDKSESN